MEMVVFRLVILSRQQGVRRAGREQAQPDQEAAAHTRQTSWKAAKYITLSTVETPEAVPVEPGTTEVVVGRNTHLSRLVAEAGRDLFTPQ